MKTLPVEIYGNVQTFEPPQYHYNSRIALYFIASIIGLFVHIHLDRAIRATKIIYISNELWNKVEVESKTPPYLEAFTSRSSC